MLFFIPSAVPSVSVGLGLLVAFSQPPVLLNGTIAIVVIAHFVLISAFSYGNVSAGLARLAPEYARGRRRASARARYRLRHVTLPLITPYLIAAFSLSFALSMGELGATAMVYPPGWVTLPVGIFALTDRGEIFLGAALTMLLAAATWRPDRAVTHSDQGRAAPIVLTCGISGSGRPAFMVMAGWPLNVSAVSVSGTIPPLPPTTRCAPRQSARPCC